MNGKAFRAMIALILCITGHESHNTIVVSHNPKDNPLEKDVNVSLGDTITLELVCNPSTGYGWYPLDVDSDHPETNGIKPENERFESSSTTPGIVGAPGKCIKEYKPSKNDTITLEYKRPWEKQRGVSSIRVNIKLMEKDF